jgi:hypothetical protein
MNIPPDLNDLQIDAWIEAFDAVFAQMQNASSKPARKIHEPAIPA